MQVSSAGALLQAYSPGYWPVPTTAGLELMTFCCATAAAVRTSMLFAGSRPPSFKLPTRHHRLHDMHVKDIKTFRTCCLVVDININIEAQHN